MISLNELNIPRASAIYVTALVAALAPFHAVLYHLWENMCIARPDTYGRQDSSLSPDSTLFFARRNRFNPSSRHSWCCFLLLLFNYDKSFLLPWKCPDKHRSSQECHPALSTWRWRLPCYRHLDDRVGGRLNYSTMFPYFQARNFEEATWAHGDGDGIELGLGRR